MVWGLGSQPFQVDESEDPKWILMGTSLCVVSSLVAYKTPKKVAEMKFVSARGAGRIAFFTGA